MGGGHQELNDRTYAIPTQAAPPPPEAGPAPSGASAYDETLGPLVSESLERPAGALTPSMTYDVDFPVNDFVVNMGLTLQEA